MTTPRSLSKVLVLALLLVAIPAAISFSLSGCTDSEQQAQLDHQKRVEEQEAKDAKAKQDRDAEEAMQKAHDEQAAKDAQPQPEQTPEAPPEPEKVNVYMFNGTSCECEERSQCGMSFWRCNNGKTYDCATNTSYVATAVVKKDNYEECNYETQN